MNPGRQLRWSSDLPERLAFQAKIPKSIVRLIMLPANIYCERRLRPARVGAAVVATVAPAAAAAAGQLATRLMGIRGKLLIE